MKRILVALLMFTNICFAQKAQVIDSLIVLAKKSVFNDYKRSISLSCQIIKLSRNIKDATREATGYNIKGVAYQFKGELDSAISNFEKGRAIAIGANDQVCLAKLTGNLGSTYFRLAKYDKALIYGFEALKAHEKNNDPLAAAKARGDIANVFIQQKRPAKAVEYLQSAISLATKTGDQASLGNFYNSLGVAYDDLKIYQRAEESFRKALKIFKETKNLKGQLSCISNLCELNILLNRPINLQDLLVAEKIAIELEDEQRLADIYTYMSDVYAAEKSYSKAVEYNKKAIAYAESTKETETLLFALNKQFDLYYHTGDLQSAYKLKHRIVMLQDSIFNVKNLNQLHNAEVRYETEKKQKQIAFLNKQAIIQRLEVNNKNLLLAQNKLALNNKELLLKNQQLTIKRTKDLLYANQLEAKTKGQRIVLLNKENTIQKLSIVGRNKTIGIILSLFGLSVIVGLLLYNRNRLKHKTHLQAQLLKQQDILAKSVIEAEENERKRIGSDLHDGVGQLFSAVKLNLNGLLERMPLEREADRFLAEKTMALVEESCKEVRYISHQMMPNMLMKSGIASDVKSFIDKIDSEVLKVHFEAKGFKNKLEDNIEIIVYRVIQETVNNVIKHSGATELYIKLEKNGKQILATIKDNGVGFDVDKLDEFEGIGLKNIATRIEYLKGTIIYDSVLGKGTTVTINVPI